MSEEKRLKARVAHKHKTEAEWYLDVYTAAGSTTKRSDPFIPLDGELIIFDTDESNTKKRFKFGDGKTDVIELPFITSIKNIIDTGTSGISQIPDNVADGFDFTGKNPNATELDPSLTGKIAYGATGAFASAFGGKSAAMGKRSHAEGTTTIAKGSYSHVEGSDSAAIGETSHAEGWKTTAYGAGAHAEGKNTLAGSAYSHAEGVNSRATNEAAHAEGCDTYANGEASHTEGNFNIADGNYAHAEGSSTRANEDCSHAEGNNTHANGYASHAEGKDATAAGAYAHAEGLYTNALGIYSHTEGSNNTVKNLAEGGHAEGKDNEVGGAYAHAEGYSGFANGRASHAEGVDNTVGDDAEGGHAEGKGNTVTGAYAHAEGSHNTVSGLSAHVEGQHNTVIGDYAHASGTENHVTNSGAHALGKGLKAYGADQIVLGRYNVSHPTAILIVGNGDDDDHPSNALVVHADGTIEGLRALYYHNLSVDFGGNNGGMNITFLSRSSKQISSWNEVYYLQRNNWARTMGYFILDTDIQYKNTRGYATNWMMNEPKDIISVYHITSYDYLPPTTGSINFEITNCSFTDTVVEI